MLLVRTCGEDVLGDEESSGEEPEYLADHINININNILLINISILLLD